ncbi:MAG: O-antigen ligase family protein [Marinilabiliaceae bacterium]|nr:O-antigen ligase family protein [Marinilabiliaceae bacterium]
MPDIHSFKSYAIFFLLTFLVFSNLYSMILPGWLYWVGLILIVVFTISKLRGFSNVSTAAFCLLVVGLLSNILNNNVNFRLVLFTAVIFSALIPSSYELYSFRIRLLFTLFVGFGITAIINYYAKMVNIDYAIYTWHYYKGMDPTKLKFQGFTNNSMWLSAACGVATIFFTYIAVRFWESRKVISFIALAFICCSIYVTVASASRSATGISLGASALLLYLGSQDSRKFLQIIIPVLIVAAIAYPMIDSVSGNMRNKQLAQEASGHTSRDALWNARFEEFESSPVIGVGFGATGLDGDVGRAETGSGWLTILSQTGLAGAICVLIIMSKTIIPLQELRNNRLLALYFCVFLYMCLHSIFEAYMFQGGWYLCLIFWMLVSVLAEYKVYGDFSLDMNEENLEEFDNSEVIESDESI